MLFLELLDEHQAFILGLKEFERLFAKGTLDDVPGALIVIQRDWSVTDWAIYFYGHVCPPSLFVLTFDIIK